MVVPPSPLQYLPNDAERPLHADEQVMRPVNIPVLLERILFEDRVMDPTDDIRGSKAKNGSGTE